MSTKWQSYQEVLRSGQAKTQAEKVLQVIHYNDDGLTRSEIAESSGMRLSSVCARVNELISHEVAYSAGVRECRITGKKVETIKAVTYEL